MCVCVCVVCVCVCVYMCYQSFPQVDQVDSCDINQTEIEFDHYLHMWHTKGRAPMPAKELDSKEG